MKKFTLLMSALLMAAGAFAQLPDGNFIIASASQSARPHGKYMAVTAEGRLITTNTINNNALWKGDYNDDFEQTISNVGVSGYLFEGNQSRNITLSSTAKGLAVMESEVVVGAYGITTTLDAARSQYVFLNALNTDADTENGGIGLWTLDEGSSFFLLAYDPSETEEQISAKVDQLYSLAQAKKSAINDINVYMNASWGGREYGEGSMYEIYYAETEEELAEAVKSVKQAAVRYAEHSLTSGATLINVRMNQPVTYTGAENHPIERTEATSIKSLWIAEPAEGEPIEVDGIEFKSFYLRNAASGKYIAKNVNDGSVLAGVDTKEEAGTMNLVMGSTGFELIINNNDKQNQYLNVSNNPTDPKLTIYPYTNDAGAFFQFNALPTFENTVLPMVKVVGEKDETGFSYKMISAVEVYVPLGATPTGYGAVEMQVYAQDWSLSTINKWTSESLADITPDTKTVEYQ